MITDKAKANIHDYAKKVLALPGGREALQEALRNEGIMLLSEVTPETVSEFTGKVMESENGFTVMRDALRRRGTSLYDTVSRMRFPEPDPERFEAGKVGISTDTETCANPDQNTVQLAMVKFRYDEKGIIGLDGEPFDRFRDPGVPISPEGTKIHGITDDMVRGKTISDQEIADYLGDTQFATAHNAAFDRKIMERDFPTAGFDRMTWACSMNDVPWDRFGIHDRKLELICKRFGFEYPAHGALDDSLALLHAVSMADDGEVNAFTLMEQNALKDRVMILAVDIPFDKRKKRFDGSEPAAEEPKIGNTFVKARGFRFSEMDGPAGLTCWFKIYGTRQELLDDVPHIRRAYGRDVSLPIRVLDGQTLYSDRLPPEQRGGFRTAMPHATVGFSLLDGEDFVPPPLPDTEEGMLLQF